MSRKNQKESQKERGISITIELAPGQNATAQMIKGAVERLGLQVSACSISFPKKDSAGKGRRGQRRADPRELEGWLRDLDLPADVDRIISTGWSTWQLDQAASIERAELLRAAGKLERTDVTYHIVGGVPYLRPKAPERSRMQMLLLPEEFTAKEASEAWLTPAPTTRARLRTMASRGMIEKAGKKYRKTSGRTGISSPDMRLQEAELPSRIDDIAKRWELGIPATRGILKEMEQQGKVKCHQGSYRLPGTLHIDLPAIQLSERQERWLEKLPNQFSTDEASAIWETWRPATASRLKRFVELGWCQKKDRLSWKRSR